jgi:hypothetical protein
VIHEALVSENRGSYYSILSSVYPNRSAMELKPDHLGLRKGQSGWRLDSVSDAMVVVIATARPSWAQLDRD